MTTSTRRSSRLWMAAAWLIQLTIVGLPIALSPIDRQRDITGGHE